MHISFTMATITNAARLLVPMSPEVATIFHMVIFFLSIRHKSTNKGDCAPYKSSNKIASAVYEIFNTSFFISSSTHDYSFLLLAFIGIHGATWITCMPYST
jgi:hypothetical protein